MARGRPRPACAASSYGASNRKRCIKPEVLLPPAETERFCVRAIVVRA